MRLRLAVLVICSALPVVASAQRAQREVPTPARALGFEPGTDRKLPSWAQVVDYFRALDAASPRVVVRTLGRTTMGRPFIAAFIADSATLANLPRYREIQRQLADPRLIGRAAAPAGDARERLIAAGKVVVLVTSSIHSTEVGGILTPLVLAHRLATSGDAEARAIRANAIIILVPSLNPDGVDIVGDWYRATLGTPAEGTSPPELYHKYVGHDNNRDWYAFTQVETQLTVDSLHNVWHPQIVNDIHQQSSNTSRIFIPPYMDPWEPNVDPIILTGVNQMGAAMTWRMTTEGFTGIANNASYDAWTPARAYQHYHGGIRILTETASARLATPIELPFDSLRPSRGYDPRVTSWNFPTLWPGGRWGIGDIIRYQTAAAWALLAEAGRDRETWLTSFLRVGERAVMGKRAPGRGDWPATYVIPEHQPDTSALWAMLGILQRGQVEVYRATQPFTAGGERRPAGTYLVHVAQPYGAFAKAILERQRYPDLREFPGGPPKRPYDVTAHTLPLLMNVAVTAVAESVAVPVDREGRLPAPRPVARGLSERTARRIAIYKSYVPSMDEGWTRWVFEQYRIPYTTIVDRDVRAGDLAGRFDAIILPDQSPRAIAQGATGTYPDSLKGGLGEAGAAQLRAFVEAGGTLVAFNDASNYLVEALGLPVRNALAGVAARDFYAPGSLLRVEANASHPVTQRTGAPPAVWFEDSPAFEITDPARATAVLTYPAQGDPLLSGWLLGGSRLNGKAALVEVRQGRGRIYLFGFRPQYRGQSMATYPLIWSALMADG